MVFESMFGNTRIVAEAVAAGLAAGAAVELVDVGRAPVTLTADLDLLVVGGPTHGFGLSRPQTRAQAAAEVGGPIPTGEPGLREWLDELDCHATRARIAAFDTRVRHLPGSAAHAAARRLHRLGLTIAVAPVSFYVAGRHGPLLAGEADRACRWGAGLVAPAGAAARRVAG